MAGWEPGLKSGKGKTDQQMRVGSPSPGSQPSAFGFMLLQPLFNPGVPSSLARITVLLAHCNGSSSLAGARGEVFRYEFKCMINVTLAHCVLPGPDHRDSGTL